MKSAKPGVYLILHKASGTCYIGSAARAVYSRWGEHRYALRRNIHRNKHLQNAWNKYGENAFAWMVLENVPAEHVLEREQYWYDLYKENGIKVYNKRENVKSQLGFHHSQATKQLISAVHKGRVVSVETRQKLRMAHLGRRNTWTAKHLAKKWPAIISPEGELHTVHNLTKFCRERKLDVSSLRKVIIGEHPHYKGWRLSHDGEQPTPYDKKLREYNINHTFIAPDGHVFDNITNLEQFAREHGLIPSALRGVAVGKTTQHHGWKAIRDGYTPKTTINRQSREWPNFVSPDEIVCPCENLYQFCKAHGLDKGAMQRLVKGQVKSHKGWRLA